MAKKTVYVIDFETTGANFFNKYNFTMVRMIDVYDIEKNKHIKFASKDCTHANRFSALDDLFKFLKNKNSTCYFHNLKFDIEFILPYLKAKKYIFKFNRKLEDKQYSILRTKLGIYYACDITFKYDKKNPKRVRFCDSLKKIPFGVKKIGKDFFPTENLLQKGEMDFNLLDDPNYNPSEKDWEYITKDTEIVGKALNILQAEGLNSMTIGGDALKLFRNTLTGKGTPSERFTNKFPILHTSREKYEYQYNCKLPADWISRHNFVFNSYKGGWCYLNPKWKGKTINQPITTYDYNSMYPAIMNEEILPYGEPIIVRPDDELSERIVQKINKSYPLYFIKISCEFTLKANKLPTIQIKNLQGRYAETEYLRKSDGEETELTLFCEDYKLFKEHYKVYNEEVIEIHYYRGQKGIFSDFINKWYFVKRNGYFEDSVDKTYNSSLVTIAKLVLNNCYGKFGTKAQNETSIPFEVDGVTKYRVVEDSEKEVKYIPMASAITSYGRAKIIRLAQANYKNFIYSDTDSVTLLGTDIKKAWLDNKELGALKNEGTFIKSKFIRPKTYMKQGYSETGTKRKVNQPATMKVIKEIKQFKGRFLEVDIKGAGMTDDVKNYLLNTYEDIWTEFRTGAIYPSSKKAIKRVAGGVILIYRSFSIKADDELTYDEYGNEIINIDESEDIEYL